MTTVNIHIGAPGTGTTVLQKHLFVRSKRLLVLSKKPFKPSGQADHSGLLVQTLSKESKRVDSPSEEEAKQKLFDELMFYVLKYSVSTERKWAELEIQRLAKRVVTIAAEREKDLLITTERLCDTSASLIGSSYHQPGSDSQFPITALTKALSEGGIESKIIVILRSPTEYLRSKYRCTCLERKRIGLRGLEPEEFIIEQVTLEQRSPFSSAIAPAFHKEFIKRLNQISCSVKAIGFKDLVSSQHVFHTLGILGEDIYSFRDFPVENMLRPLDDHTGKETVSDKEIEARIIETLERFDYLEHLNSCHVYI
jgi:hypothetical protein